MRRSFSIVAAFVVVVLAGWTGLWFYVAGEIRDGFDNWVAQQRQGGGFVEHGDVAVTGYPMLWRLRIDNPALRGTSPMAWEWRGESLTAALLPWQRDRIPLEFGGIHRLIPLGEEGLLPLLARAESPRGNLLLSPDGSVTVIEFDLGGLDLAIAETLDGPERVTVEHAKLSLVTPRPAVDKPPHLSPSFEVGLAAETVKMPPGSGGALGPTIGRLGFDVSLMGAIPPGSPKESLAAWRDDGGTLELRSLRTLWGKLDLNMSGTLALDSQMRPEGALTAIVRGFNETIDAVVAHGLLRGNQAAALKVAMGLMARTPPEGGPPQLNVPLSAQDGTLSLAGLPLARLPALIP